jgi:chaperonin GroES
MNTPFKIQPILDQVIIKRVGTSDKIGSLFIPEQAKLAAAEGYIVAVGSGRETDKGQVIPMHVRVGDRVVFERGISVDIKVDGVEYAIVQQDKILGIVDPNGDAETETVEVIPPVREFIPAANAPKFG